VASPTAVVATTSSTLDAGIWFYGQEGDDTLVGNDEQTNMAGGRGADTFVCNQEGEDIIVDYRPEQEGDVIENPKFCDEVNGKRTIQDRKNPYAICHIMKKQYGWTSHDKWQRCVNKIKKKSSRGKSISNSFLYTLWLYRLNC